MFAVYFIVFIVLYALLCSIEFIVFNEEILLALCFFSFVFFSFNSFSDSVFTSLSERASKFESDFLVSFSVKKKSLKSDFQTFFSSHGFQTKFNILLTSVLVYLTFSKKTSFLKYSSSVYATSFAKLTELTLINNKLVSAFQKKCVVKLLYPLIFKSTKTELVSFSVSSKVSNSRSVLKLLSI